MKAGRARHRSVAGQHVGIESHVGRAARICVIAQANKFGAQREAEFDQRFDILTAQLGAKDNHQPALILQPIAHLGEGLAGQLWRGDGIARSIISREKLHEAALGSGSDLCERRSLPVQLDGRGIHYVQFRPMQAHVRAYLPRQQRMLFGRVVADQQNCRSSLYVAHARRRVGLAGQG